MKVCLQIKKKNFNAVLIVPGSKSISNRMIIFQALSKSNKLIPNISTATDTQVLKMGIKSCSSIIDIGDSGTAFRFLTSYFSIQIKKTILTGSNRMKTRPIKDLVDALNFLGADIQYLEKDGFPPLRIIGKKLQGGKVSIDTKVSSQFVSSLLMIAPSLKNGLILHMNKEPLSTPYIQMTLELMSEFGIKSSWKRNIIEVYPRKYIDRVFKVESDWSSISYLFECVALSEEGVIYVDNVKESFLQGDYKIAKFFNLFGVSHSIKNERLSIYKSIDFNKPSILNFDCSSCPDLAQTIAATACGLGIHTIITGLDYLPFKETDRLSAVKKELEKTGVKVCVKKSNCLEIIPTEIVFPNELTFSSHGDHRMAMSLAPLALKIKTLWIEDAQVIKKSYPNYWEDLKQLSFKVNYVK